MSPYFLSNTGDFEVVQGDCMQLLQEETRQFNMIFADPPYFLSKGFAIHKNGKTKCFDKGEWDKVRSLEEINQFNRQWLSLCKERLKDGGTIWVTGTYHNIFSVAICMQELGYKILNLIVWYKPNAPETLSDKHFNFSAEYIVWARKDEKHTHQFNFDLTTNLNGGKRMPDVWAIDTVETWEKHFGKHPTQKPLRLLHRAILSCTQSNDLILDPFAGSGTTGIAAVLNQRRFVGYEMEEKYLQKCVQRYDEVCDQRTAYKFLERLNENPNEDMVVVNHANTQKREQMIEKGLCYLRAGDSKGSLLVQKGFERVQYVLLHTKGEQAQMFKLLSKGRFEIWTRETLEQYGFSPEHAAYYVVLRFDNQRAFPVKEDVKLCEGRNTYTAKLKPLREVKKNY